MSSRFITDRLLWRRWWFVLPVVVFWYSSLFAVMWWRYPATLAEPFLRQHVVVFSAIFALWLLVWFVHQLFDPITFITRPRFYRHLASAVLVSLLVAVVVFYSQPQLALTPRRFLLWLMAFVVVLVVLWYEGVMRWFLARVQHTVFVHVSLIASGVSVDDLLHPAIAAAGYTSGGVITELPQYAPAGSVVLLPHTSVEPAVVMALLAGRMRGYRFMAYRDFFQLVHRRVPLPLLDPMWLLAEVSHTDYRFYTVLKRALDIVVGLVGVVLFALSYVVVAPLLWWESGRPILFRQQRVGQHGRPFWLYKYRTMTTVAGGVWTAPGDARITPLGRWLRAARIDELPQFLNIVRGDMSLVGPRPEQVVLVDELARAIPWYHERHSVKPGLTGWSQLYVYAASVAETERKLEYDLYYLRHRSLWFDLEIIVRTIYAFVTLSGR